MPNIAPPPRWSLANYTMIASDVRIDSAGRARDSRGRFISQSDATHSSPSWVPMGSTSTYGSNPLARFFETEAAPPVERRPFRPGDVVRVHENPSSHANPGGYVAEQFHGAEGVVTTPETDTGRVDVNNADFGGTNVIHRNWLTLLVSAPETPADTIDNPRTLLPGDMVRIQNPAYYRANGSGRVPRHLLGREVMVIEPYGDTAYTVSPVGDAYDEAVVHRNYLDFLMRPAPLPVLRQGAHVRVSNPAFGRLNGTSSVSAAFYGAAVTVDERVGDRYLVRNGSGHGQWVHGRYLTAMTTAEWDAIVHCDNSYCGRTLTDEDDRVIATAGHAPTTGCEGCTSECAQCDDVYLTHHTSMVSVRGQEGLFCPDCVRYCHECGNYILDGDDECPFEDSHPFDRGVRGYGHTTPSMWIGGPLPKVDGKIDTSAPGAYYIGFELEISADDDESAMPIYEWAEQHLGSRDAIQCKEDSSLNDGGFEIVTMPMTPAFFESVDWESFMDLINRNHPLTRRSGEEPTAHGLHVHIGRIAFGRDDVATAAYTYLLSQSDHLDRIARREPYHYCAKVRHPVSVAIQSGVNHGTGKQTAQVRKIAAKGIYPGRDAINLQNEKTIEIRAFRSTRSADELRDAVRATYVSAEYIRSLRMGRRAVSPKALHWSQFAAWVGTNYPEAFPSIAGIAKPGTNRRELVGAGASIGQPSYDM